jgi:hypothetical protein
MGPFEGLGPDIVEGVRHIKSQDGPNLILWGSSMLTSTLLAHGLADEVLLVVYPVLLGTGKRFFAEGTPPRSFELISTQTTPIGIILSAYKFAGSLKAGIVRQGPPNTAPRVQPSLQRRTKELVFTKRLTPIGAVSLLFRYGEKSGDPMHVDAHFRTSCHH